MECQLFAREHAAEQRELGAASLERAIDHQLESVAAIKREEWSKSIRKATLHRCGSIRRWPKCEFSVQVSNVSRSTKANPDPLLADNTGMYVAVLYDLGKRASQMFHVSGHDRIFLLRLFLLFTRN